MLQAVLVLIDVNNTYRRGNCPIGMGNRGIAELSSELTVGDEIRFVRTLPLAAR